jgi:hypothetical protein
MHMLSLYCKSFSADLKRVIRLSDSISRFNSDNLPFIVSVPRHEIPLFKEHFHGRKVLLLADEEIIRSNRKINPEYVAQMPGNISQQVVKSEFWRLGLSDAYLCLDSDVIFIRPFSADEFIAGDGTPYTVINEGHDLMLEALKESKTSVIDNFQRESKLVQDIFKRSGKAYSFGPMPMVWHRAVWESLDTNYLIPNKINFAEAINMAPLESRWYGEALLKFKAIPLLPSEPFFMVYHYAWQLDKDIRNNIRHKQLSKLFSGVVYQSSWDRQMDWPREGGGILSQIARRIRRALGLI